MDLLEVLATWFTIIGGVWLLFEASEKATTLETKAKASSILKNVASASLTQSVLNMPNLFVKTFDDIFGENHFTKHCFLRSCIASISVVVVISCLFRLILHTLSFGESSGRFIYFLGCIIAGMSLNFIPDYISLLETRWILNRVGNTNLCKLTGIIVIDFIFTFLIFSIWFFLIFYLISRPADPINEITEGITEYIDMIFYKIPGLNIWNIFLYSTFFTSIYLYLFLLSTIVIKVIKPIGKIGDILLSLINIDEKPFQSMGWLAITGLTICFVFYGITYLIIKLIISFEIIWY